MSKSKCVGKKIGEKMTSCGCVYVKTKGNSVVQ